MDFILFFFNAHHKHFLMHNKRLKKGQNHLVYLNVCSPSFSQKTIREKVRSELPRLIQPELASWECSLCTGHHT